jgi:hypothetical protein
MPAMLADDRIKTRTAANKANQAGQVGGNCMWFFYLCGGLILLAFLGVIAEARQMARQHRSARPEDGN